MSTDTVKPKTQFTVRQISDNVLLEDVISGSIEAPGTVFDKVPEFTITVPTRSGIANHILAPGKEVQIKRAGRTEFIGIIDTPTGLEGLSATRTQAKGVHKGYHLMRALECTNYDFEEDGLTYTTRDGVTINPWDFFVFRATGGDLDSFGQTQAIDGIQIDDAVRALIGTRFIHQHEFRDNSILLPSQSYTGGSTVYRDGVTGDKVPRLQRMRDGVGFIQADPIESIPLYSGDRNVREMGNILSATVLLIGLYDGTSDPLFFLARNAVNQDGTNNASRTYTGVTLTRTDDYLGTGLTAWSGSLQFTDSAAIRNALGWKMVIQGPPSGPTTTKLDYIKVICTTESDTGIEEGVIEPYVNPFTIGGEENWIAIDLQGMNRLEAAEKVRLTTESGSDGNGSTHWDMHIDTDLKLHFQSIRGSVQPRTYSFANENIRKISHRFNGNELAYQTIAYGAGSGNAQSRIVSKADFNSGGLYDEDRDPNGGTQLYGKLPRIVSFVDAGQKSAVALRRKSHASHRIKRDPIESVEIEVTNEHIEFFEICDFVLVRNVKTITNRELRIVELQRSWGGDRESVKVRLGEPEPNITDIVRGGQSQTRTLTIQSQPNDATTGAAGNGLYFDATHFGVYSFGIDDGSAVERVLLRLTTQPWQATIQNTTFGIFQFNGDAPGTSPIYGSGIKFAVDPNVQADGLPSNADFNAARNLGKFGSSDAPVSMEFDVTGFMGNESNGVIRTGEHKIFFQSEAGTNNAGGLSVVSITPIIKFRSK